MFRMHFLIWEQTERARKEMSRHRKDSFMSGLSKTDKQNFTVYEIDSYMQEKFAKNSEAVLESLIGKKPDNHGPQVEEDYMQEFLDLDIETCYPQI